MKQIYEFSFKVSGEVVDAYKILRLINGLKNDSITVDDVHMRSIDDIEGMFHIEWSKYCMKRPGETDDIYNQRISEAKAEFKDEDRSRRPDYRFMLMKLQMHKAIKDMTAEDWDRILQPEKFWKKVRKIENPGIEICKKILWDLAAASNNPGPVDHLEDIETEEQWQQEAESLIHQLECKEYDETFDMVINYLKYPLQWKTLDEKNGIE